MDHVTKDQSTRTIQLYKKSFLNNFYFLLIPLLLVCVFFFYNFILVFSSHHPKFCGLHRNLLHGSLGETEVQGPHPSQ